MAKATDKANGKSQQARAQEVDIGALLPDPKNPRDHGDRSKEGIEASMRRFGAARSVVVDKDGIVRAGNGALEAAKAAGIRKAIIVETKGDELVVVRRPDWNEREAIEYSVADNRLAELSSWNEEVLSSILAQNPGAEGALVTGDVEALAAMGFDAKDLDEVMAAVEARRLAGAGDLEDEAPAMPDKATTEPGTVWTLGSHRLMCGDSCSEKDLDRLLGGKTIQLVNMDPPYNVKVEPRSNNAIAAGMSSFGPMQSAPQTHHQSLDLARHPGKSKATHKKLRAKDRPLANDFVSDQDFEKMLLAWFGNASRVLDPGRGFYIWGGYANVANYPPAMKAAGFYFSQAIIWVKEHPVLTRKDFMGNHEWCFYGWKEGAAHWFNPDITNATDVWAIKKVSPQKMVHLTEKPVELAYRAMIYSSRQGENVLDLFGGSGSTLMGAEKAGRSAFLMELDPLYCDVIVHRWCRATGREATFETAKGVKGVWRAPAEGEDGAAA